MRSAFAARKLSAGCAGAAVLAAVLLGVLAETGGAAGTKVSFKMVRSGASVAAGCLPNALAKVVVTPKGPVENMTVHAKGLPAKTDFDLFVTQVPNAPFGISWYVGDLQTDVNGVADGTFVGRFSIETFAVAPGSVPAPVVHNGPFPDASTNPPFSPVHTFHLGLWFNASADAVAAGCAGSVTPFNGVHNAGVQALSTNQFGDLTGPLRGVTS